MAGNTKLGKTGGRKGLWVPTQYACLRKASDQTLVGVNTDIVWDTASPNTHYSDDLTFDGTLITLPPGVWLMTATLYMSSFSIATGVLFYEFVKANNSPINSRSGFQTPINTSAYSSGHMPETECITVLTAETQFKLRVTADLASGVTATVEVLMSRAFLHRIA